MARKASVRYWESRGAYCCEYRGKQIILAKGPDDALNGPTYQAALKAFGELTSGQRQPPSGRTYEQIWQRYEHIKLPELAPSTQRLRRAVLTEFVQRFKDEQPERIDQLKVKEYLISKRVRRQGRADRVRPWNDGSVAIFSRSLNALHRWAMEHKLITEMPPKIKCSDDRSRARECVLAHVEYQRIIEAESVPTWREYWIVLHDTGARPSEISHCTAANFDAHAGTITYFARVKDGEHKHKTYHKGKDRVIIVRGEALQIMRDRARDFPKGPLFGKHPKSRHKHIKPGMELRPWSKTNIGHRAMQLRDATGIRHFVAYSFRHTFATTMLMNDMTVEKLAVLMGNTPETIHKHYSHLLAHRETIAQELERIMDRDRIRHGGEWTVADVMNHSDLFGLRTEDRADGDE